MTVRVYYPRFARGFKPSVIFLVDSFAYLRASWGTECYMQQLLEFLYFSGVAAVAVVMGGARIRRGDYETMYSQVQQRFSMDGLVRVIAVSMGNDLISSTRPLTICEDAVDSILAGLRRFGSLFSCEVFLVYGGSAVTWGYPEHVRDSYDWQVAAVIAGIQSSFCYVTSGVDALAGATPVDSIGHLDVCDADRCVGLFISLMRMRGSARL